MPDVVSLTRPQSPDIGKNSDAGISGFRISGENFKKIVITQEPVMILTWNLDQ